MLYPNEGHMNLPTVATMSVHPDLDIPTILLQCCMVHICCCGTCFVARRGWRESLVICQAERPSKATEQA